MDIHASHSKSASCPRSVLDILKKREIGFDTYSFEERVVSLNLQKLHCTKEIKPNSYSSTDEVSFLKGGEYTMYLELSSNGGSINSFRSNPQFFSSSKYFPTFKILHTNETIVDVCDSMPSTNSIYVLVISSDAKIWKRKLLTLEIDHTLSHTEFYTVPWPPHQKFHAPIWCCHKSDFTAQFVLGMENCVAVSGFGESSEGSFNKRVRGEVRSVQFDKQGSVIYTGLHTGEIEILDSRTNNSVFRSRLHNRGIDEIVLVFGEKQLVCGAFDGMLRNFDLRMRKPICEFNGHVHDGRRKVPFSTNEANDLLCATGSDNVTRLWCLGRGGDPVKCIKPPEEGHQCRSWLISDGIKCLLYQYQRSNTYIYGTGNIEDLPESES